MENRVKISRIFGGLCLLMLMGATSCGPYHKLLKSRDPMEQYTAANGYYLAEKYSKASSLYELSIPTLIGTEYEDTILFRMGNLNYQTRNYYAANEIMNQYRQKFPKSPSTPMAEYLYSMSFYKMAADVEKDQEYTRRAIVAFNEFINRYPDSDQTPQIQELINELHQKLYYKTYLNASIYYQIGQHLAAITSLRSILKNTPETPYRQEIMYLICKSWFEYAYNSVPGKQLDRYLNTIDAYYSYKTAFPDSEKHDRELGAMKEIAEDFVAQNGTASQSLENSAVIIKNARETITEAKDDLFETKGRQNKQALRQKIKDQRAIIKTEKAKAKTEAKTLKEHEKAKIKEIKTREAEITKAEKKAAKNN